MASRSLNRVTLIGHLGKDPELKTLNTGMQVCKFSLATSERYKDKNGEWKENTDWHNITCWDKLAEIAGQYLRKGKQIYLEGRISYNSYEKDGITRYTTDIIANNLLMLGTKDSDSSYQQPSISIADTSNSGPAILDEPVDTVTDDDVPF